MIAVPALLEISLPGQQTMEQPAAVCLPVLATSSARPYGIAGRAKLFLWALAGMGHFRQVRLPPSKFAWHG